MLRRSTRIAVEALAGLLIAVLAVGGAALWRLNQGPVSVDFLTPRLQAAFNAGDGPLTVEVGQTQLVWGGWERTVDLLALDWRLIGPDGRTVAQVPEIDVTLSLRALAEGVVAPTRIQVRGASLTLERDADGQFGFRRRGGAQGLPSVDETAEAAPDDGPGDIAALVPPVLDRLLAPANPDDPLTFLRAVEGEDLRVTLIDRRMGTRLQARDAVIALERRGDGLDGEATLTLDLGEDTLLLRTDVAYAQADERLDLSLAFRGLALPALARVTSELAPLSAAEVSLDGEIGLTVGADGILEAFSFDLAGARGQIRLTRFYDGALPVQRVAAQGRFYPDRQRLAVEDLHVELGTDEAPGPALRARLNLDRAPTHDDLGVGLRMNRVEVADLSRYWPKAVAENARDWVLENVTAGGAENLELVASVRLPNAEGAEPQLNKLAGGFDIRDLELHYLRPMPPITQIQGRADVDPDGLTFALSSGTVDPGDGGRIALSEATARIFGLSTPDHSLDLEFTASGALRAALALLDHERLKLVRRLGVSPADVAGTADARVAMAFPLVDSLREEDLDVRAGADLREVALADAALGLDVTDGSLRLTLDPTAMRVAGTLALGPMPGEVDWTEYFAPADGIRRRLTASTDALDDAARRALDLPMGERVAGSVAASIGYTASTDGSALVAAELGLSEAALSLPELEWSKPAGAAGSARLTIELWDERLVALRDVEIAAGTLAASGSASFAPNDGRLLGATISRLSRGGTELRDIAVAPWDSPWGPGWDVRVAGGALDAAPWLKEDEAPPAVSDETEPPQPLTPLALRVVRLQSLDLGEGRGFEGVALDGRRGPTGWESLTVEAEVPRRWWRARGPLKPEDAEIDRKALRLDFAPAEAGGYALTLQTDDFGATLRALDWVDDMEGGRTRLTATTPGPLLSAPLQGQLEVRDYTLIDAPLVGRILAGASLGGLGGMLAEDRGITFERGTGDLVFENGVLSTDLLRAYGPALGITARGTLDTEADALDLDGTVVPAYAINQVLGAIPILGPLLTGGEGEGVLGVTYTVDGPLSQPEVDVNLLSALAPGFLRGIFRGKVDDDGDEEALQALPPQERLR